MALAGGRPQRLAARRGVTRRAGALCAAWLRVAARSWGRGWGQRPLLIPRRGMAEPGPESGALGEEEAAAPAPKKRRLAAGERYVPPPRKLKAGVSFSAEHFAETSYYFEGGLRKVRPYYYDFRTYCKGRWVGRSLLHVFSTEFRAQPLAFYRAAARAGRLRLNEEPVRDLDVVLKVGASPSSFPSSLNPFFPPFILPKLPRCLAWWCAYAECTLIACFSGRIMIFSETRCIATSRQSPPSRSKSWQRTMRWWSWTNRPPCRCIPVAGFGTTPSSSSSAKSTTLRSCIQFIDSIA